MDYLTANKLDRTLQALKTELLNTIPQQPSSQLLSIIKNHGHPDPNPSPHSRPKPATNKMSQDEVENTMHKLVNRLALSSQIINNSSTNTKI